MTGSRHLLHDDNHRLLVDCGMYQGVKNLRRRNWAPFPVKPGTINAVVLTHAHIDHSGYLQEEDAKYAFRKGFSKHDHPEPLFTQKDAHEALKHFESVHYHEAIEPVKGFEVTFTPAGHILGSSCVHVHHKDSDPEEEVADGCCIT